MSAVTSESLPDFFAAAPLVVLRDPLAEFLGAAAGGILEYRYADAVRLAGHSCPTVAAAFLMTRAALLRLYGEAVPVRGEIRVDVAEPVEAGVAGVTAAVASLLTGAAGAGGFRGLAGRFNRRDTLLFGQALTDGSLRFTRLDDGRRVEVACDLSGVPGDPLMGQLLPRCLDGRATAEERARFGALWQDRLRRLLLEHADDPAVIRVTAA